MSDYVSRKELAEEFDVAHQRIDTLVREGKLTPNAEGLISRAEAEQVWAERSPKDAERVAIAKEIGETGRKGLDHPLVKARAMEAVYAAKHRELKFKIANKEVVHVSQVKVEAFEIGRALQQRLLAFPARMSSELATLAGLPANEIEPAMRKRITEEVRKIIEDMVVGLDKLQASNI